MATMQRPCAAPETKTPTKADSRGATTVLVGLDKQSKHRSPTSIAGVLSEEDGTETLTWEEQHAVLRQRLADALRTRTRPQLQQIKAPTDEESQGTQQESFVRDCEETRWNLVTPTSGVNAQRFPVLGSHCGFDARLPQLRGQAANALQGPLTDEDLQRGRWGIASKQLEAYDANQVVFPFHKFIIPEDAAENLADATPEKTAVALPLDRAFPLLRSGYVLTSALTPEDLERGLWGIEHKELEAQDVNSVAFPLPEGFEAGELRKVTHAEEEQKGIFYADTTVTYADTPLTPLTDAEKSFFEAWGTTEPVRSCHASAPFDCEVEEKREVAWRYYTRSDIIAEDLATRKQIQTWEQREKRGTLSDEVLAARRARLLRHFSQRAERRMKFLAQRPARRSVAAPADAFFGECVNVFTADDAAAAIIRYADMEAMACEERQQRLEASFARREARRLLPEAAREKKIQRMNAHFGKHAGRRKQYFYRLRGKALRPFMSDAQKNRFDRLLEEPYQDLAEEVTIPAPFFVERLVVRSPDDEPMLLQRRRQLESQFHQVRLETLQHRFQVREERRLLDDASRAEKLARLFEHFASRRSTTQPVFLPRNPGIVLESLSSGAPFFAECIPTPQGHPESPAGVELVFDDDDNDNDDHLVADPDKFVVFL